MGQQQIGAGGAERYYKDQTMDSMADSAPNAKISLIVSIEECEGSKYSCKTFDVTTQTPKLINTPEEAMPDDKGVVRFQKTLIMEYYFEKDQQIVISIDKTKDGSTQTLEFRTSVGNIVGSRQNTMSKRINNIDPEKLSITVIEQKDSMEYLFLDFDVKTNKPLNFIEPRNFIYFFVEGQTPIYKSETISKEGRFNQTQIPLNLVKPTFTFTVFDCKQRPVARIVTSVEEFTTPNGKYKEIAFPLSKHRSITLINKSTVRKPFTFIDYFKQGAELDLIVAIDCTGSNGSPDEPGSLHFIGPGFVNDYEKVITSCGTIVSYYDYAKNFAVFGFGASLPGEDRTSFCFNMNSSDSPDIYSISGVLEVYHRKVMEVSFSGPTLLAPTLSKTIDIIRNKHNKFKYHVLIILIDGISNDTNDTKDLLVLGAKLPMSVIIIGIGNANFSHMETLNNNPLVSSTGEQCVRNIVQFVPFSKFKNNQQRLAEEVLKKIPRQFLEYYTQNSIYPETLW